MDSDRELAKKYRRSLELGRNRFKRYYRNPANKHVIAERKRRKRRIEDENDDFLLGRTNWAKLPDKNVPDSSLSGGS